MTILKFIRLFLIVFFLMASSVFKLSAQKIIHGFGPFLGLGSTASYYEGDDNNNITLEDRPSQLCAIGGLTYVIHTNLYEISTDKSVALDIRPAVGIYSAFKSPSESEYGVPIIYHMPVMLQYSSGNFSTRATTKDYGFGVGLGFNYQFMLDKALHYPEEHIFQIPTSIEKGRAAMIQPALHFSFRKWNFADFCVEYSLNVGFGSETFRGTTYNRNTYLLSLVGYLNY